LILQTSDKWQAILINDGPDSEAKALVEKYTKDFPIQFIETEIRYNDWGHTLRDLGLGMTQTKWINWNNGDNYLTPRFVEWLVERGNEKDLDFVYCDILHSYFNVNFDGKIGYNVLKSFPAISKIDIANFIIRTDIAKNVGFKHRDFAADGLFIKDLFSMYPNLRTEKVESCLVVHN
jgi:hypothetical protein